MIEVDLESSWYRNRNVPQTSIKKEKNPSTGTPVPVLSRAALYQGSKDDPNIYLWGGTTSPWNTSFPDYRSPLPAQFSLWSYEKSSHSWSQFDTGLTIENRPNSGASAEAPEQGLAFYFNGMLDDHSQQDIQLALDNSSKPFLEGMIVVDTINKTAKNISTQAVVGDYPRSRGKMEYVKEIGPKGILVMIGGNRKYISDYSNQFVGDLVSHDVHVRAKTSDE